MPGEARFEGRSGRGVASGGHVVRWDALAGPVGGFRLSLDVDAEVRVVEVQASETEDPQGRLPVWVLSQPGLPESRSVHPTLWAAVTAAWALLCPGWPGTQADAGHEVVAGIIDAPGAPGPPENPRPHTVRRLLQGRSRPGVWAEVDDDLPPWVRWADAVTLYRQLWAVDPDFQTTEFRTKPGAVGFRVDFAASLPERQATLNLVTDAWLDEMDTRAPGRGA